VQEARDNLKYHRKINYINISSKKRTEEALLSLERIENITE
jgi:hypothetical protein